MNALIPKIAVSVVPEPVPVVMKPFPANRIHRRRPTPEIIVHTGGDGLRAVRLADARPGFVTETPRDQNFSDVPGANPVDGLPDSVARTTLGPGLNDFSMLAGGFHQ